ncbi:hypothetical protein Agub_g14036, partial [Astrephomene gubernaculifera]
MAFTGGLSPALRGLTCWKVLALALLTAARAQSTCTVHDDCDTGSIRFCNTVPFGRTNGVCEDCWKCCLLPDRFNFPATVTDKGIVVAGACSLRCGCNTDDACTSNADCAAGLFCMRGGLRTSYCAPCTRCASDSDSVDPGGCASACPSGAVDNTLGPPPDPPTEYDAALVEAAVFLAFALEPWRSGGEQQQDRSTVTADLLRAFLANQTYLHKAINSTAVYDQSYVEEAVISLYGKEEVPLDEPLDIAVVAASLFTSSRALVCPKILASQPASSLPAVTGPGCPCNLTANATYNRCPVGHACSERAYVGMSTDVLFDPVAAQLRGVCLPCNEGLSCGEGVVITPANGLTRRTRELDCPAGSYCPSPGEVFTCPPGYYCGFRSLNRTSCNYTELLSDFDALYPLDGEQDLITRLKKNREPIRGNYCPEGSTKPSQACSAGYYCPNASVQLICPSGYYCKQQSIYPVKCPRLVRCPEGTAAPDGRPLAGLIFALIFIATYLCYWLVQLGWFLVDRIIRFHFFKEQVASGAESAESSVHVGGATSFATAARGLKLDPLELQNQHYWQLDEHFNIRFFNLRGRVLQGADRGTKGGISGLFEAGSLSAIMGASGCGKTTLILVLSGRMPAPVDTYNEHMERVTLTQTEYRRKLGYVPQDDVLHTDLTVRENLAYAARLKLPRDTPQDDRYAIVNDTLKLLELYDKQDKLVGTPERKIISGGQRKRVSIGVEIVGKPPMLFMDEPTSGLDAARSSDLCNKLSTLAESSLMNIIAVIHQPRYSTFMKFNKVLLLATEKNRFMGRPVYQGPPGRCVEYFCNLGFDFPVEENHADTFLDIMSDPFRTSDKGICVSELPDIWKTHGEAWLTRSEDPLERLLVIVKKILGRIQADRRKEQLAGRSLKQSSSKRLFAPGFTLSRKFGDGLAFLAVGGGGHGRAGNTALPPTSPTAGGKAPLLLFSSPKRPMTALPAIATEGGSGVGPGFGAGAGSPTRKAGLLSPLSPGRFQLSHVGAAARGSVVSGASGLGGGGAGGAVPSTTIVVGGAPKRVSIGGVVEALPSPSSPHQQQHRSHPPGVGVAVAAAAAAGGSGGGGGGDEVLHGVASIGLGGVQEEESDDSEDLDSAPEPGSEGRRQWLKKRLAKIFPKHLEDQRTYDLQRKVLMENLPLSEEHIELQESGSHTDDSETLLQKEEDGNVYLLKYPEIGDGRSKRISTLEMKTSKRYFTFWEYLVFVRDTIREELWQLFWLIQRNLQKSIRAFWPGTVLDVLLLLGAAFIVGAVQGSKWGLTAVPSNVAMIYLVLSVLATVTHLRTFTSFKNVQMRERTAGISVISTFLASNLTDLIWIFVSPAIYFAVYYYVALPRAPFAEYYNLGNLVCWWSAGLSYLISVSDIPAQAQPITAVITTLILGAFLNGIAPTIRSGRGNLLEVVLGVSYNRWAMEAGTIKELMNYNEYKSNEIVMIYYNFGICNMDKTLYDDGNDEVLSTAEVVSFVNLQQTFNASSCDKYFAHANVILFCMGLGLRLLAFAQILYQTHERYLHVQLERIWEAVDGRLHLSVPFKWCWTWRKRVFSRVKEHYSLDAAKREARKEARAARRAAGEGSRRNSTQVIPEEAATAALSLQPRSHTPLSAATATLAPAAFGRDSDVMLTFRQSSTGGAGGAGGGGVGARRSSGGGGPGPGLHVTVAPRQLSLHSATGGGAAASASSGGYSPATPAGAGALLGTWGVAGGGGGTAPPSAGPSPRLSSSPHGGGFTAQPLSRKSSSPGSVYGTPERMSSGLFGNPHSGPAGGQPPSASLLHLTGGGAAAGAGGGGFVVAPRQSSTGGSLAPRMSSAEMLLPMPLGLPSLAASQQQQQQLELQQQQLYRQGQGQGRYRRSSGGGVGGAAAAGG